MLEKGNVRPNNPPERLKSNFHPLLLSGLLLSLYLAQGIPSGFLAHALPAIMRDAGVSVEYIGLLKLLALPWFLKVLWAPVVDQYGQRSSWIISMQLMVAGLLLLLAYVGQAVWFNALALMMVVLFAINLFAATQDVATDGLAVKYLPKPWLGIGNSIQVGGYKLGMIASGSGLLILLDYIGWEQSFALLAFTVALLVLPTWLILRQKETGKEKPLKSEKTTSIKWFKSFKDALKQPHWRYWLPVLVFYKVADALGSGMIKPLLVDTGLSLSQIGELTLVTSTTGLVAAALAGIIYLKVGAKWSLVGFGLFQALSIGAFALPAIMPVSTAGIYAISMAEQAADGFSTVALFAMMMHYCRQGYEGTDYTLQASLQLVVTGTVGLLSGFIVKVCGYPFLFCSAMILGLLASFQAWHFFNSRFAKEMNT